MDKHTDRLIESIYLKYGPSLIRYAQKFVAPAVAEDIVHDLFLSLWDKELLTLPEHRLRPLLFVATRNLCIDNIRREQKKRNVLDAIEFRLKLDEMEYSSHQEKLFMTEDLKEKIFEKVSEMPPKRRDIFLMYYAEGLKAGEISEKLNISVRTVENQLYRSLLFLREHFPVIILMLFHAGSE